MTALDDLFSQQDQRKRKGGCSECGGDTTAVVQVMVRRFASGQTTNGYGPSRSYRRPLCDECAVAAFNAASAALDGSLHV